MSSEAMSLKGRIKNYAKSNNIAAQVVLQNYMFECFLARLAKSEYREMFVVKGGMLIAAIVGLDTRSTMDLDTTLRNLPLTEEKIAEHRGSTELISDVEGILKQISESDELKDMWKKYQKKFAYASDIMYEDVLVVLRKFTR